MTANLEFFLSFIIAKRRVEIKINTQPQRYCLIGIFHWRSKPNAFLRCSFQNLSNIKSLQSSGSFKTNRKKLPVEYDMGVGSLVPCLLGTPFIYTHRSPQVSSKELYCSRTPPLEITTEAYVTLLRSDFFPNLTN